MNPTTSTSSSELPLNAVQPKMDQPSLRTRIVTKAAAARLAVLQTALRARDGAARLSEKFFSLFRRSKKNSIPAPSTVVKSPVKQSSPVAELSPLGFKGKDLTSQQTAASTPVSAGSSPKSPVKEPNEQELAQKTPPSSVEKPAESEEPEGGEAPQPILAKEIVEPSKEATETESQVNANRFIERIDNTYQLLMNPPYRRYVENFTAMALGGLIVYLGTANHNKAGTTDHNKAYADGYQACKDFIINQTK